MVGAFSVQINLMPELHLRDSRLENLFILCGSPKWRPCNWGMTVGSVPASLLFAGIGECLLEMVWRRGAWSWTRKDTPSVTDNVTVNNSCRGTRVSEFCCIHVLLVGFSYASGFVAVRTGCWPLVSSSRALLMFLPNNWFKISLSIRTEP